MPKDYEIHPIAQLFPPMKQEEFGALVKSIKRIGQLEPCLAIDGQIADGRNRYYACRELGIDPLVREATAEERQQILSVVFAKNLERRHMSASQKACVGVRLKDTLERDPAIPSGVDTRDIIGERIGVSGRYIDMAAEVQRKDPALFEVCWEGGMPVSEALESIKEAEREQRRQDQAQGGGTEPSTGNGSGVALSFTITREYVGELYDRIQARGTRGISRERILQILEIVLQHLPEGGGEDGGED